MFIYRLPASALKLIVVSSRKQQYNSHTVYTRGTCEVHDFAHMQVVE